MNAKKSIVVRVYAAFGFVCLLGLCIAGQIFSIQRIKGHYWKQLSDSFYTDWKKIQPMRGNIYATDGSLLATSVPIYTARMDLSKITITPDVWDDNIDSLAFCLNEFYHKLNPKKYSAKTPQSIKGDLIKARRESSRSFLLSNRVTHSQLKELRTYPMLRLGQYRGGFIVESNSIRMEPFLPEASRTIGYKKENVKPVGLEGYFDKYLAGREGKRLMQKVAGGAWIPINDQAEVEPKDGEDIVTNIDVNFQDVTENALLKAIKSNGADHGCAVVMDVKTGQVKAIANLKRSEDENGDDTYAEELNYAVTESSEPGSTFKLMSVMAMLEYGGITPNTTVDTKGGETTFFDDTMRDSHKGGYGVISLQKAFALSSNVGISTLAFQAFVRQPHKFTDYIAKLGLNKPLGIEITGEGAPFFRTPKDAEWSGTSLPWMSIGYEIKMTPLQILTLYNAIANNGVMVKPQLVRQITQVGKLVKEFQPVVLNEQVCSPKTLKQVQAMLQGVVQEGTATNIRNDEYNIAGKTGTARISSKKTGYKIKNYQASFVGYFPAEKPMYSIIVVINKPSKGLYYANMVAAPVFKEIADKIYAMTASTRSYMAYFEERRMEPLPFVDVINKRDLQNIMAYTNVPASATIDGCDGWLKVDSREKKVEVKNYDFGKAKVPDVNGMVLSDALYVLETSGLKVKFHGKGRVKEQSLDPGTKFFQDETIEIKLD